MRRDSSLLDCQEADVRASLQEYLGACLKLPPDQTCEIATKLIADYARYTEATALFGINFGVARRRKRSL